ncbi:hypothetical protein NCIMB2158_380011 [Tenacibaculum maritimum]|uniref:hypothetical protein n=1 Tax=Tenacibaculum maritimum TaxID=107401 RepID=UPI0012E4B5F9|nr:hypothetical protein [Tenacibaculum maritimum]CAA0213727.1 hypothetical protein NCIMB2158_380011 [Tenacibaculum maritimum]
MKLYNRLIKKTVDKIKLDKLQVIIIIIVTYSSVFWYLYPFLDKKSIFPLIVTYILVGLVLLTGFVVELLKVFGIIKPELLKEREKDKRTIIDKVFDEKMYEAFLEIVEKTKNINQGDWNFDNTYMVVFAYKLFNNGFLKRKKVKNYISFDKTSFHKFSEDFFEIKYNKTFLSTEKYIITKQSVIDGRIKESDLGFFYFNVLKPFGDD